MVGQEELVSKIKSYSIANLPQAILLLGEEGCGKHTLANEMANYFGLELIDLTDDINLNNLTAIRMRAVSAFYLINVSNITEKEQNMILKFVEEPSPYVYIILVSNSSHDIIDTLYNRCNIFQFSKYTREDLMKFVDGVSNNIDEMLELCSTPGQLKLITKYYDELMLLCSKFNTKLKNASFSNLLLAVVDRINYKDEYDKFDFYLFIKALKYSIAKEFSETLDEELFMLYNIINEYSTRLVDTRLNKQIFMENLMTTLWKKVRGDD